VQIDTNPERWAELMLDMPFATPPSGLTHDAALTTPGCYVKTREPSGYGQGPKQLGRLLSIVDGIAVVCSNAPYHDGKGNPFVWRGSLAEYLTTWKAD
jgi:hypothetical protein